MKFIEDYISLGVTTDEIRYLLADSHETVLSKSTEEDFKMLEAALALEE